MLSDKQRAELRLRCAARLSARTRSSAASAVQGRRPVQCECSGQPHQCSAVGRQSVAWVRCAIRRADNSPTGLRWACPGLRLRPPGCPRPCAARAAGGPSPSRSRLRGAGVPSPVSPAAPPSQPHRTGGPARRGGGATARAAQPNPHSLSQPAQRSPPTARSGQPTPRHGTHARHVTASGCAPETTELRCAVP